MDKEIIGFVSGILVTISAIPYSIRVWQKKITPNIISWILWSFIGLALLLNYFSSGAKDNIWPAVFGFTNPLVITGLAIWKKAEWKKLVQTEIVCVVICPFALVGWWIFQDNRELVQYSLYLAILADACAAVPTIFAYWKEPELDRPFAWALFAIGYGLAIFAISEHTFTNYVLPVYMFLGASVISLILLVPRVQKRIPLKEWV